MDTSEQGALNADSFLHGPVLVKAEMKQTLPLLSPTSSLGPDLPNKLLDFTSGHNLTRPSSVRPAKKEMVMNMNMFMIPQSLEHPRFLTDTMIVHVCIVSAGCCFFLGW